MISSSLAKAARPILRDLPQAEMHRLESGHFAVEDCLEYIARNILRFFDEKVASK